MADASVEQLEYLRIAQRDPMLTVSIKGASELQALVDEGRYILVGSSIIAEECPPELIARVSVNPDRYQGSIFGGPDCQLGSKTTVIGAIIDNADVRGSMTMKSGYLSGYTHVVDHATELSETAKAEKFSINADNSTVSFGERTVRLTPHELRVFTAIIEAQAQAKPIDALQLAELLNSTVTIVTSHLTKIRRTLEQNEIPHSIIRGYSVIDN